MNVKLSNVTVDPAGAEITKAGAPIEEPLSNVQLTKSEGVYVFKGATPENEQPLKDPPLVKDPLSLSIAPTSKKVQLLNVVVFPRFVIKPQSAKEQLLNVTDVVGVEPIVTTPVL